MMKNEAGAVRRESPAVGVTGVSSDLSDRTQAADVESLFGAAPAPVEPPSRSNTGSSTWDGPSRPGTGDTGNNTHPSIQGHALRPGMRLQHYELIRELGSGGMGTVFLARDVRLGRRVAIKFLHSEDADITRRFILEARATARCSHENIVIIYEVGEFTGGPFMVLEYLQGKPLTKVLGNQRLPPARAVELMVPVVRALECAHEQGIVHRDLKPENIVVTDSGAIKVLDFGIAKVLQGDEPAEAAPGGPRVQPRRRSSATTATRAMTTTAWAPASRTSAATAWSTSTGRTARRPATTATPRRKSRATTGRPAARSAAVTARASSRSRATSAATT
uniref:serine/threonine-protein kinase n=1 Tax=Corallococcus coralloides TaxID=184914 RepID=UPI003204C26D